MTDVGSVYTYGLDGTLLTNLSAKTDVSQTRVIEAQVLITFPVST